MDFMDKTRKRVKEIIVKIPHRLCYKRYGKTIEKTIQIQYGIPCKIVQEGEIEKLVVNAEMATVIYKAEVQMETARKRVSEFKVGEYIEGLSEIQTDYRVDEVAEEVERRQLSHEIQKAIGQLSAVQQQRIILYYFYGLTSKEIAALEGVSITAIHHSLKQAEKKLKKILKNT